MCGVSNRLFCVSVSYKVSEVLGRCMFSVNVTTHKNTSDYTFLKRKTTLIDIAFTILGVSVGMVILTFNVHRKK